MFQLFLHRRSSSVVSGQWQEGVQTSRAAGEPGRRAAPQTGASPRLAGAFGPVAADTKVFSFTF